MKSTIKTFLPGLVPILQTLRKTFKPKSFYRYLRRRRIDKKTYILLHTPRSGGTNFKISINNYVSDFVEYNDLRPITKDRINFSKLPSFYMGSCLYTEFEPEIKKNIQWICLLRNPLERIESRYFYLLNYNQRKNDNFQNIVNRNELTIQEYCLHLKSFGNDNLLTRMLFGRLQCTTVDNVNPTLESPVEKLTEKEIQLARSRLSQMEIVLTADLENYLSKKFGVPLFWSNRIRNDSIKSAKLSKEDIASIQAISEFDLRLYNEFSQNV